MAGFVSRTKNREGVIPPVTLASAAVFSVPSNASVFLVTGTTTVTSIRAQKLPGREITLIGTDNSGNAFENSNNPTTEGAMDLGGSNVTLASTDVLKLTQLANGSWLRSGSTDN